MQRSFDDMLVHVKLRFQQPCHSLLPAQFKTNLHVYPLPSALGRPLYRSNSWKSIGPNAHVLLQSCRRIKSDFFSPTQEPDTFDHELAPVNFEDLKNDMNTHALSNLNPLAWWLALSAWGAICKRTAPHHEWLGLLQRSSNLHVHGHYWQNSHTAQAMWSESGCMDCRSINILQPSCKILPARSQSPYQVHSACLG